MLNHHTRATVADPGLSKRGRGPHATSSICQCIRKQLFANSSELLIINCFVVIKKFLVISQTIEELSC